MSSDEKKLLNRAFDSNWIAPIGPQIDSFEDEVSDYINIKSSCALSSGTAALHLAVKILGISKNDFVLCPSLTFSATANVIMYENANPIFIDSDPKHWTFDISILERAILKYKPKAIITVDLYGQSCDYDTLIDICKKYNVHVIEDAAEAMGSTYKGKKLGSFGSVGVLSFNGNKIITTSGGGMLLSQNEEYIKKAKFLSTQSREPSLHYEHKELGYNYRMSNLLASIGRGQLKRLDKFVEIKRNIFNRYKKYLSIYDGIDFLEEHKHSYSNRWLTTLKINEKKIGVAPKDIIKILSSENIESRPVWKPMHMQPFYKNNIFIKKGVKDVSRSLFEKGLCLPSGSNLSIKEQDRIIDIIISQIRK